MDNPYSDEYMIYDEARNRYTVTEEALISRGIDLRARIGATGADASAIIEAVLLASRDQVYRELHKFSLNTVRQDNMITHVKGLRPIIYEILLNQAEYYIKVGDLGKSEDINRRKAMMYGGFYDDIAEEIPCIGTSLIYSGGR
ncbi:MAG: hypothetical protein IJW83_00085 [Clostridia bacterium]|nr:hypothetical protein [Clostridia bacterium]